MVKKEPKRRAWRKAKIEDVEEAVEDEKLVQKLKRQGGPDGGKKRKGAPVTAEGEEAPEAGDAAEGDADELFTVDTAGSGEGISARQRREIARQRLFPPKAEKLGLSASEQMKVERAENRLPGRQPARPKGPEFFDLWSAPPPAGGTAAPSSGSEAFKHIRSRKYMPQSVPGTLHQKVGKAPAVVPAHEGQSANPDASAYENLTFTAAARELERERENEELDRKIRPLTHSIRDLAGPEALQGVDESAKVEMYRSLVSKGAAAPAEVDEEGVPVREGRGRMKSQAQKNKLKKQKVKDERESQEVRQRRLEKSVGEVGAILKEMKAEENLQKSRKQYREQLRAEKQRLETEEGIVPKRRKLGRTSFVEQALVVPDADTARKGLRAARLKGSAIQDRISSIVRRGMVTAPPEASKSEAARHKTRNGRHARGRKYLSPLLRDRNMIK